MINNTQKEMENQGGSSTPGSPKTVQQFLPLSLIILGIPILLAFISTAIQDWDYIFDDAFITYRYARNLAMGYGITWNPGLPPTEGYTNFLLVLILAPVIKAGLDPLLVTRVLSYICAIAMAGILFAAARHRYNCSVTIATMVAALIFLVPATKNLCLVGLETVIYAFFLLITFIMGVAFIDSRRIIHSVIFSCLLFLTMLLRPEAVLLYPVVFVAFVATAVRRHWVALKPLMVGLLVLLALGGAYLTWKYLHFGQILPNPFYLKVSGQDIISWYGIRSVMSFLNDYALFLALVFTSLIISFFSGSSEQHRDKVFELTGVAFLFIYCLFFAHTDTLQDIYGRFLYPLVPIIILLIMPVLARTLAVFESVASHRILVLSGTMMAFLLAFGPLQILGMYDNVYRLMPDANLHDSEPILQYGNVDGPDSFWHNSESLTQNQYRISKVLARFPQITEVRIAFGDSGIIAYFSGAIWLDVVGLNDGFIARTRDKKKLVDYFFNWSPDLAIHPGNEERSWLQDGHGPLGDYLSWASDSRWDEYVYVGTSKTIRGGYDLQYFVRKSSRFRSSLEGFLKANVVDGWYDSLPLPIGTYNPNKEIRPMWIPRGKPHG